MNVGVRLDQTELQQLNKTKLVWSGPECRSIRLDQTE